jgi:hypothetical protein
MVELEKSLTETLGTRVIIEANAEGGRLMIDFFSPEDLSALVAGLAAEHAQKQIAQENMAAPAESSSMPVMPNTTQLDPITPAAPEEREDSDDDLYAVKNFVV